MSDRTLRSSTVPSIALKSDRVIEAIHWLYKQNFAIASGTGVVDAYSRTSTVAIGILKDEPKPAYTSWWRFLLSPQPRREFIGVLWFDNPHRGTNGRTWIFDVYGKDNLDAIQRLSAEMSRKFNMVIRPHLMDDVSRLEDFV